MEEYILTLTNTTDYSTLLKIQVDLDYHELPLADLSSLSSPVLQRFLMIYFLSVGPVWWNAVSKLGVVIDLLFLSQITGPPTVLI